MFVKYTQTESEFIKFKNAVISAPSDTTTSNASASSSGGGGGNAAAASAAYAQLESEYKKVKEQLEAEQRKTIEGLTKTLSLTEAVKAKDEEIKDLTLKVSSQEEALRKLQSSEGAVKDIVTLYNSENKNLRKETESQRDLIRQEQVKNEAITAQFIRQSEEIESKTMEIALLKDKMAQKDTEIERLTKQQQMLSSRGSSSSLSNSGSNANGGGNSGFLGFFRARHQQEGGGEQQQQQQQQQKKVGTGGKRPVVLDFDVQIPTAVDRTLEGHSDDVQTVVYSTSGNLIATGSVDKTVRLWSADMAGQPPMVLKGATKGINKVMFSLEDDLVLGCSNDNSARIWKVMNGTVQHTFTGHSDSVTCGTFIPNSQKMVTGSKDRMLKIWDITRGNCVKTIPGMSSCNDCVYLTGTQCLATAHADKSVRLFDINTQQRVDCFEAIHTNQITGIAASDDGRRLFTLGRDDSIKMVDSLSKNIVTSLSDSNFRTAHAQARLCVAPGAGFVCAGSSNGNVFIWDVKMFKLRQVLIPDTDITDKS